MLKQTTTTTTTRPTRNSNPVGVPQVAANFARRRRNRNRRNPQNQLILPPVLPQLGPQNNGGLAYGQKPMLSNQVVGYSGNGKGSPITVEHLMDACSYLRSLINPEMCADCHIPDGCAEPTATYQTIVEFPLTPHDQVGNPDDGRFFLQVRPCFPRATTVPNGLFNTNFVLTNPAVGDVSLAGAWAAPISAGGAVVNAVAITDPNAAIMIPQVTTALQGLALRARTVSMSVWLQYRGSTLNNAGTVTSAYVSGNSWTDKIAKVDLASGGLYWYENVAKLPNSYSFRLSKGCYSWWSPSGERDRLFYPTDTTAIATGAEPFWSAAAFPSIIMAGVVPRTSAGTAFEPVQVRICLNMEYTTDSRVTVSVPRPVAPFKIEYAAYAIRHYAIPHSVENDTHTDWVDRIFKVVLGGVAGFLLGGPIGLAMGLLSGGGMAIAAPPVFKK